MACCGVHIKTGRLYSQTRDGNFRQKYYLIVTANHLLIIQIVPKALCRHKETEVHLMTVQSCFRLVKYDIGMDIISIF